MCGICGIFNCFNGAPADLQALERATAAMVHRGPDDEGHYADGALGLGNRRLSIIDLPGGHQPLSNEDGSLHITFNGEIYNYRELRSALAERGHCFRTSADTEVILHLYEERGTRCLEDLRGMFAFALWDARSRRLFLARDRAGIKPLYYRASPSGLAFSSEIRSLRELSPAPLSEDPQAIFDFFSFRYVPAPRTMYHGVQKLPPGTFLLADSNGVRFETYWDVPAPAESLKPERELEDEISTCLRDSVRLRLISDVPLGLFLSGGMDSGAVLSYMAELGARPLRTFSVGFDEPGYSELPLAREAAERYGAEHQELSIGAGEFKDGLCRLAAMRTEPLAEPTDVALYEVSQLAAKSVKVVLAGEGGDEVFAGYPKYAADQLAWLVRAVPSRYLRGIAQRLPFRQRRAQTALEAFAARDDAERYACWFASFTRAEQQALFSREFLATIDPDGPAKVIRERLGAAGARSPLKRMLYADLKVWLPDNLLQRGDYVTMAASIEERLPLLDHKLIELAATIPDRMLVRGLKPKVFFRKMLADRLSPAALARRKIGFTVPVGEWFRGPLKEMLGDSLLSPRAAGCDYFDRAAVERYLHEHWSGARDRRKQLWALLSFELWRGRISG